MQQTPECNTENDNSIGTVLYGLKCHCRIIGLCLRLENYIQLDVGLLMDYARGNAGVCSCV